TFRTNVGHQKTKATQDASLEQGGNTLTDSARDSASQHTKRGIVVRSSRHSMD
ncbi:unnamed protein product, partial [Ectocarpus sp. 8 AP-2014]